MHTQGGPQNAYVAGSRGLQISSGEVAQSFMPASILLERDSTFLPFRAVPVEVVDAARGREGRKMHGRDEGMKGKLTF